MKKLIKSVAAALAILMLLSTLLTTMMACSPETPTPGGDQEAPGNNDSGNNGSGNNGDQSAKVPYTVTLKNIGGRAIPNITFYIYKGEDLTA